ncbi:hypothetical protein B0H67DRAFT_489153 [Lasiosphaeris hirsuta]|uniref:Uncharacterized protein n=1 Tax=Lasiosphaeris hirsuta TaxID=260670 RepID=A0AA40AFA3_9PEZI|nr:hypothetical protein B0H67DRAFT_489153 [Lasiosphaeris hirsuta]
MSRNIRQKYQRPPARAPKRRDSDSSSSLNLSDDDGYSAVEDVSDSDDDDDEHVFAAEEKHIISNALRKRSPVPSRPVEPQDEDEDADEEDDDDNDDEADDDDLPEAEIPDDGGSWEGILSDHSNDTVEASINFIFDQDVANIERHVRFTGVPESDSDSTTSETSEDQNGFFPDIFVDQSSLDPGFRREVEKDTDSSNSGSFWDFNSGSQEFVASESEGEADEPEDMTPTATPMASAAPTAVSSPVASSELQELDGYETDGDTTEEDVPEPPIRRKQVRRVVHTGMSSDSDTEKPTPFRRGKPRVGRFNLDSTDRKPIAVLNPTTRKMMIFTPQRMSRLDLSPESFNIDFSAQDLSNCSPILSNPGYVMMGAMFSSNTFGDFMNTQPFGPAEAFFPLANDYSMGPLDEYSEDSEFAAEAPDEGEGKLKLEDFITFHQESSDEDEEEAGEWNGDLTSSPSRPRTAASGTSAATDSSMDLHPLLSHFDNNSDAVGAFRRNQINQQLIFSDKASQESLAFSGPYYHGTLRGIKTGSMETVTTPITPARRHKRNNTAGMHGFDPQGSPPPKRKASGLLSESVHKKHRSISDIDILQI